MSKNENIDATCQIVLLPCPFCGGKAEMVRTGTGQRSCQVSCTNCNCHHESSDEHEHSGSSWNTREPSPNPSVYILEKYHNDIKSIKFQMQQLFETTHVYSRIADPIDEAVLEGMKQMISVFDDAVLQCESR